NDTTGTNTFAFTASEADIYIAFSRDDTGIASEFYIDNVLVVKSNNLITNGTFDSDLSNWTDDSTGTASVSWNAAGTIQFNSTDAQNRGRASQSIQTEAGESYELTFESAANTAITIYVGTSTGSSNLASQTTAPYTSTTFIFVATTSTTHLRLLGTANTNVAQADNILVVKV
ncbi:MAG: hypothetical protein GY829_15990, partial [Gammaproteobacteria bacterium]|nr:hypothetical protein [Gammaproteobacteria bacterium]